MPEHVYCLPADALPEPQRDVLPLSHEFYKRLATEGRFLPRAEVEEDTRWRQIIPYAVLERGTSVFLVKRLKAGTEARLHDRLSIGIGGHINPLDHANARDVLEGALTRELREELHIRAFFAEAVGLIHASEGPVDRVHTGVLYRVRAPGDIEVRETHKLSGGFVPWAEVAEQVAALEGWSQMVLRFLEPVPAPPPAAPQLSG